MRLNEQQAITIATEYLLKENGGITLPLIRAEYWDGTKHILPEGRPVWRVAFDVVTTLPVDFLPEIIYVDDETGESWTQDALGRPTITSWRSRWFGKKQGKQRKKK